MTAEAAKTLHGHLQRFTKDALRAASSIGASYGVSDLLEGRRSKQVPRSGTAGDWTYTFHGAGLRASAPGVWVDFDFLPGGGVGGFDPWKIRWYLEENNLRGVEIDVAAIEALFLVLEAEGRIVRADGANCYVLAAEVRP